eukprot:TRINITY_DN35337_c0_g1_i1.p1 TRINITY_DN35337_c0_g1~~TRINITY_DN35337_c0_g1_i1.p1  ORF type:complete len:129 (-),score=16.50 TRINITY_DN35337_c0_g1_i1:238-624(-)
MSTATYEKAESSSDWQVGYLGFMEDPKQFAMSWCCGPCQLGKITVMLRKKEGQHPEDCGIGDCCCPFTCPVGGIVYAACVTSKDVANATGVQWEMTDCLKFLCPCFAIAQLRMHLIKSGFPEPGGPLI